MLAKLKKKKRFLPLFILMVPGLTYLIINNYMPMAGMVVAFKDVNYAKGIFKSDWIGLRNFEYLFKTKDALLITRNTILYNLVFIVLGTSISIMTAIFICDVRNRTVARTAQTILIFPALISWVVIACLTYGALSSNGIVNRLLKEAGKPTVSWYMTTTGWPYILTGVHLWKSVGFQCIIFISNITGISQDYFEAARVDGASKWKQIRYITIPLLKPTIIMVVTLALGRIFYSDFGLFYQVPRDSGSILTVTNTIDTYVFRGLMKLGDVGMSSAACAYQSMVGFIIVLSSNMLLRKISPENALF